MNTSMFGASAVLLVQVQKSYRTVVGGCLGGKGYVDIPLDGKPSLTQYRCIRQTESGNHGWVSTLDLYPHTGTALGTCYLHETQEEPTSHFGTALDHTATMLASACTLLSTWVMTCMHVCTQIYPPCANKSMCRNRLGSVTHSLSEISLSLPFARLLKWPFAGEQVLYCRSRHKLTTAACQHC